MITKQYFGMTEDGRDVYTYLMSLPSGMSVRISQFGGAIVELRVPDRYGRLADVVCGYDALQDYLTDPACLGALIGRVCNRIDGGAFTLDGKTYRLYQNDGQNSLHGGRIGFSDQVWDAQVEDGEEPRLILSLESPDGEENYPGTLQVTVTYTLLRSNALSIRYHATTDRKTIVNLTNHAYFNLGGFASGRIFGHVLQMDADAYLPTREDLIPTGEIRSVKGTPFDFRSPKSIGADFDLDHPDLKLAGGFDHCLCFRGGETREPALRIEVWEPTSGRAMQVYTNQPAVQLYSGNFMYQITSPLKGGLPAENQIGFCLETQKMPDAINHPSFSDTVLAPGEVYEHITIFQFSTK